MSARSWDELRLGAKRLEGEVDSKLIALSQFSSSLLSSTGRESKSGVRSTRLALDEEEGGGVGGYGDAAGLGEAKAEYGELVGSLSVLLASLRETVDGMGATLSASKLTPPAAKVHTLHRDRDILRDFEVEFRKVKSHVDAYFERKELLEEMDEGIAEYKSAQESLLREARAIDATDRMTDALLGSALASRNQLIQDGNTFGNINSRLGDMAARFPVIGNIMGKIKSKKKRDMYILASVVAACIIFSILFWWNR